MTTNPIQLSVHMPSSLAYNSNHREPIIYRLELPVKEMEQSPAPFCLYTYMKDKRKKTMSNVSKKPIIELTVQVDDPHDKSTGKAAHKKIDNHWENEGGAILPDEKELKTPDFPLRNGQLYKVTGQTFEIVSGRYVCKIKLESAGRQKKVHRPAHHLP